jgi:hypothetical protein
LAVLAAWLLAVSPAPWDVLYWKGIRSGNRLVAAIEDFKRTHGRLPDAAKPEEMTNLGLLSAGQLQRQAYTERKA